MGVYSNLPEFARFIYDLLKTDRDVNLGTAGFTGEGKSTFLIQLFKEYDKVRRARWDFDRMTWSRKELLTWIDGSDKKNILASGLYPGQLPEYSSILIDELFMLFYRRNWYDEGQIDSIGTLNMCRDRHLLLGGNIPNFWDLDGAFTSRIRFFIYIPKRGEAWIFEQENNPFSSDPWNASMNRAIFRKYRGDPSRCPNFVCAMQYPDLSPEEKAAYLAIRNSKRREAIHVNKDKREKYIAIKIQRDALIRMLFETHDRLRKASKVKIKKLSCKDIGDVIDISDEAVRLIMNGQR